MRGRLHQKIGTSPKEEYKRLERISNEARMKSEQTRLSLEQHVAAHQLLMSNSYCGFFTVF